MFELSVMMVNNTGCVVSPGGSCIISSSNLTFTTNSPGQDFDIKLEITDGPNYGKIQRLRSNGKWVTTKRFSQRQLEKEKIDREREVGDLQVSFKEATVEKMEIKNKLEQLQKEKGDHEREVSELLAKLEAEKEEKMQVKLKLRMMEERSLKHLESLKKTDNMMETILAKYVRKKVV